MKALLLLAALANGILAFAVSRNRGERETLARETNELEARLAGAESSREDRRALAALVATYGELAESDGELRELGIAPLRDTLLRAERGLGLERLSLEFRPETDLARGLAGSRVQASLRGSYGALYRYLARLESRHLPLAPADWTLRGEGEGEGSLSLSVRFRAVWPEQGASPGSLAPDEVTRLTLWLRRGGGTEPAPNPFVAVSEATVRAPSSAPQASFPEPDAARPEAPPVEAAPERRPPVLVGFVLARPEVEPDVERRVLAALRFEGKLYLVAVGERVGPYAVEAVGARESVTLVDEETGERLLLRLG